MKENNGTLKTETADLDTTNSGVLNSAPLANNFPLVVGNDHRNIANSRFKGNIYNVSLFTSVRTEAQVTSDFTTLPKTTSGIVLSYDLTGKGGYDTILDLSGNGYNLKFIDNTNITLSQSSGVTFNTAGTFYKVNSYINQPINTLEAWIKVPTTVANTERGGTIFGSYNTSSQNNNDFSFEIYENGNPRFYARYNSNNTISEAVFTNVDVRTGQNLHIAFAIERNLQQAHCYINGVLKETKTLSNKTNKLDNADLLNTDFGCVGGDHRNTTEEGRFKGTIYSVAVYTCTRKADFISADKTSVCPSESGLIGLYTFNGKQGNEYIYDQSESGNHLMLYTRNQYIAKYTDEIINKASKVLTKAPNTFEAWVNMPKTYTGRGGVILGNYNSSPGTSDAVSFEITEAGQPRFYARYNNDNSRIDNTFKYYVNTGNDTHIAMTLSRGNGTNGTISLYINGRFIETQKLNYVANNNSVTTAFTNVVPDDFPICVGGDHRSTQADSTFKGIIYSACMFSDVRNASEIKTDLLGVSPTADNIILSYKLNGEEAYPTTIADLTGNGYDTTAYSKNYILFEQNVTYEQKAVPTAIPKTVEALIKLPKGYASRAGVIFGNYGGASNSFNFEIQANGKPRIRVQDKAGTITDNTFNKNVATGEWVHVAITIDGTTITLYVDGVAFGTTATYKCASFVPTSYYVVGGDVRSGNSEYFKGLIQHVKVFSDVRSASEIASDMTVNTVDNSDAKLICAYNLSNAASSTVIQDLSKNDLDLNKIVCFINDGSVKDPTTFDYSFAVVGDTQKVNIDNPSNFPKIYDYIINNKTSKKIAHVFGLGDITDDNIDAEYNRAATAFKRLETAGIPYSIVRGNHDGIAQFTKYFGKNATVKTNNYAGEWTEYYNDTYNSIHYFSAGVLDYMVITLDYGASDAVLNWASTQIARYPYRNVIITTHTYMFRDGTTLDSGDIVPPSKDTGSVADSSNINNGDHMWNELISKHPNIVLAMSGHDPCSNVVLSQWDGVNGNKVSNMLIDPQGLDDAYKADGGVGAVAMLYFSNSGKTVTVRWWSTIQNCYIDSQSQFTFTINTISRPTGTDTWDGTYPTVTNGYAYSGKGTSNNPYLIYTAQDLAALSALSVGKNYGSASVYYKVMRDIDLSNSGNGGWRPICDNDATPGDWPAGSDNAGDSEWKAFTGVFDGNGHTITYNETKTSKSCFGLFFSLYNATVKNLTFAGTISKMNYVGTVAVLSKGNAIIENVTSNVTINVNTTQNATTQARVGGIIGQINGDGNKLTNCTNNGNITALNCYIMIGGLCGFAYGNVTLSGNANNKTITNGTVTANSNYGKAPNFVGYLIGSYASNKITITWDVNTNGGVWGDSSTANKTTTLGYGEYVTAPDTATKGGNVQYSYPFAGWATSANGQAKALPTATQNITYYAIFNQEVNKYDITWKIDGQEDVITQVEYGAVPSYNGTPEKQDYTFKGWSALEDGNVLAFFPQVIGEATYYAIFYENLSFWDGTYPNVTLGYAFEGAGSYNSPFLIYTAQDLAALSALSRGKDYGDYLDVNDTRQDYYYKVMADIDLSCGGWIPICDKGATDNSGNPIPGGWQGTSSSSDWHVFRGNFNGNGHTIIFGEENNNLLCFGLFIGIESAVVENLNFAGSVVGSHYLSCVSPLSKGWVRVENVTSDVDFTLSNSSDPQARSGAIIGQIIQNAQGGTNVINCKNSGDFILADNYVEAKVGGLVGFGYTGLTLESNANGDCANTGIIKYVNGTILNDVGNPSADYGIYPLWVGNLVGDYFSNKIIATWVVDTTEETTQTLTFEEGYGQLPVYKNASGNESPTKTTQGNYAYQFMGWSLTNGGEIITITPIKTPTTYYAVFEKTFTITISGSTNGLLNGSNSDIVIEGVLNGTILNLSGNPITINETVITVSPIANDAQYTREFAYWTNNADAKITSLTVSDNTTIKAYFNLITNTYTITWKNYNDEVLLQTQVAYGEMPTYTGETPIKPATNKFSYSFSGWNPELVSVTNDAIYTAQFMERAMLAVNLSLKGTVGINFYMDVKQYTQDEGAYLALTYNHNTLDYKPDVRTSILYLEDLTLQDGIYLFSIPFASGQIAENIKLELFDSGDVLKYEMPSYSIMKYCEDMIGASEETNLVNLCKSLINYGIRAMTYFDEYESGLENPSNYLQTIEGAPSQVPQNISGSAMTEGATYLSFERYSFLALSDTSIRIYFTTENNMPITAYNVSLSYNCESTMAYKTGGNDYGFFVEIYGIESTNISELFTVTLTPKFDSGATTITYSALHYLSKVYYETTNENLKAMCLSIYHYNACARAYFYGGNAWETF